ncbi:uncharacterized protein LOC117190536 [Drosophila miranda]|uniref:uncharacterized protein LOC117190536 n=1 Tax=Drosophila miranda TaxID=7229 RepID=UPI00143F8A83|nr:uncharacterized protein LOC117190536 [Drosophila miranda]
MADLERIRLVLLGGAGVGKSSIVKRFLFKTYTDKYRATVEDLYNREYDLGGVTLKDIPIVIAGNKADLAPTHWEVKQEEVTDWVFCELLCLRAKVLECSAKEDSNVTELFKSLLSLSRFLPTSSGSSGSGGGAAGEAAPSGFKRRSSAYVSASSSRNKNRMNCPALGAAGGSGDKKPSSLVDAVDVASTSAEAKLKPRSRSLIRRASRKTKQQINNASDDCNLQ